MRKLVPPTEANRLEVLRTLKYSTIEGGFSTAFAALAGGSFVIGLAHYLHASDYWLGILSAVPAFAGLVQFPASMMGQWFSSYKWFALFGGMVWRLTYIALAFVPFLPIEPTGKLFIMACVIAIASVAVNLSGPTYNEWVAEMVPPEERGFYYSRRTAWHTGIGAAVGLLGALVLDQFKLVKHEDWGYGFLFGLGVTCGLIGAVVYLQMRDIPRKIQTKANIWATIQRVREPLGDRNFRRLLIFLFLNFMGQTLPGGFFTQYALDVLHMKFAVLQTLALLQATGMVLSFTTWGTFVDRFGNRPMLMLAAFGIGLTPTMWLLTDPHRYGLSIGLLCFGHFVIGSVWAGVNLCQGNILLATAPEKQRAIYIGAGQTVMAMGAGIGPLVGAAFLNFSRGLWIEVVAYKALFALTMVFRLFASFWVLPVNEPGSKRIREALTAVRQTSPTGVRALRKMKDAHAPEEREQALKQAGDKHFTLATEDVIKALHDPTPKVRRQAAYTLAQLQDPAAVDALLHQLQDHPEMVEEETIFALGQLGDARAVPLLTNFLQSPSSQVRRATAKAMGVIGHASALPALVESLKERDDVELRRASLQALRLIGSKDASDSIVEALMDPHPSVRIAASEAATELNLKAAAGNLRAALVRYQDDGVAEAAYALGCVGATHDIGTILAAATHTKSVITRRRCLLGVAALLKIEDQVYRLFALEGMRRDQRLIEMSQELEKRLPGVKGAVTIYSEGQELDALEALLKVAPCQALRSLRGTHVEEGFILAVVYLYQTEQPV